MLVAAVVPAPRRNVKFFVNPNPQDPRPTRREARTARVRATIAILVAAVSLAACAAPQVAYRKLDWLASWKLGQYVELDPVQAQAFETDFRALWDWHRASELDGYGQDLRALAQAAQQPMSRQDVRHWAKRAEDHSQRVIERALDPACGLLASFDDAQRDSVLERIDHNIDEDAEEYLDGSEQEIRRLARKRMRKGLERWVGELDERQEALLDAWAATRPQRYREWIEERRRWRDRLAAVLDRRGEPGFCGRLQALVLHPRGAQDGDLVNEANAQAWIDFLASFSATLDARQREHLHDRLVGLARDFEALQQPS